MPCFHALFKRVPSCLLPVRFNIYVQFCVSACTDKWANEGLPCTENMADERLHSTLLMYQRGVPVPRDHVYCLMQEYTRENDLNAARLVHSIMICNQLDAIPVLGDHLIRMFAVCGSLPDASHAFVRVLQPTVFTWNAIISAHAVLGECEMVLELYYQMHLEGISPVKVTFLFVIKACNVLQNIELGRLIHEQLIRCAYEADKSMGSAVIDMYRKFGSLEDGRAVFDRLPDRDAVVWGTMVVAYTDLAHQEHGLAVLELYQRMQDENITSNATIFSYLLKASCNMEHGRLLHHHVVCEAFESDVIVGNSLIDMYTNVGELREANNVFFGLPMRNVASWASIMSRYVQHEQSMHALLLFKAMEKENEERNEVIFTIVIKACASTNSLILGRLIHHQILKSGLECDIETGSALVDMYAKCGSLQEACKVFDTMGNRNEIAWSIMIAGHASHGDSAFALELFHAMQTKGFVPNKATLLSALEASADVRAAQAGRLIHNLILKLGLPLDMKTASTLVDMYAKCGSLGEAFKVFNEMPEHDIVVWSAIIGGYAHCEDDLGVLSLFGKLQEECVKPDKVVYLCVLKVCGSLSQGRLIHHEVIKSGIEPDVTVESTLVDMYARCGSLNEAYVLFYNMEYRDVVAWSVLIASHIQHEHYTIAFDLFEEMQHEGIDPNQAVGLCMAKACQNMPSAGRSMLVHAQIVECGFDLDVAIGSTLVSMHVMGGSIPDASDVFKKLSRRDVVSWSTMMGGYVLHEHFVSALESCAKMGQEGVVPDKVLLMLLLRACSGIGALREGNLVHKQMIIIGCESVLECGTAIADMYVKCGCSEDGSKVSATLLDHSVVAWSTMIPCYEGGGNGDVGKHCLGAMQQVGLKPDKVAFLNMLTACSRGGLLEESQHYFTSMADFGTLPDMKHFNCMVDLLSRVGHLQEAQDLLRSIPLGPDIVGWLSLLSSCKAHDNMKIGVTSYGEAVKCDETDASGYVLMSSLYSRAVMGAMADHVQELRKQHERSLGGHG